MRDTLATFAVSHSRELLSRYVRTHVAHNVGLLSKHSNTPSLRLSSSSELVQKQNSINMCQLDSSATAARVT